MKSYGLIAVLLAGLMAGPAVHAQQTAAPAGSTGQCKDGSYTDHATKKGACSGHKGVKEWYNAPTGASAPASNAATTAPAAAVPTASNTMSPKSTAPASGGKPSGFQPPANAAPGGGPGLVWINESSKVYHCQGDKWYGKTKSGAYMSEADAKAKGYHPDHGKACTQ